MHLDKLERWRGAKTVSPLRGIHTKLGGTLRNTNAAPRQRFGFRRVTATWPNASKCAVFTAGTGDFGQCTSYPCNHTGAAARISLIYTETRPRRHRPRRPPHPFAMVASPPPLCPRRSPHMLLASSATEPAPNPTPTETFRIALGAGAVAGFTVDAVLFPLDTLKTRMQLASSAVPKSPAALLTGLYAGFAPAVVASAPAAAAFFGVYDYVKRILQDFSSHDRARLAPLCHVVAAAAGDVAASTVRAPFEVVKQRLQSGLYSGA